jgi:hypothetical protein
MLPRGFSGRNQLGEKGFWRALTSPAGLPTLAQLSGAGTRV